MTELDNVSDYGDLGDDPEEAEILTRLLAEIEQPTPTTALLVIDIEDYEAPRGAIVPSSPIETRQSLSQPNQEVVCDESSSGEMVLNEHGNG